MFNPLPAVIFAILAGLGYLASRALGIDPSVTNQGWVAGYVMWLAISAVIASAFRIAAQWEKALVFRLGRFKAVKGPGIYTVVPFADTVRSVDTRIITVDIPAQQAITKDNVPITTDAVIFMRVREPEHAVVRVQNYIHAIRQYAQTALRDVIGAHTLDQILADREAVGHQIEQMVDHEIEGWGLDVAAIRIQDIILPEDLKRVMARQASAEREKRANITKSEGDREAAENLASAATMMATAPGALQLRTLQTLDGLGSSQANTVVLAVPVEVMQALQAIPKLVGGSQTEKRTDDDALNLGTSFLKSKPAKPELPEQSEQKTSG